MTPEQEMGKMATENRVSLDEKARMLTMEREANQFAMELLMPTKFMIAEIEKMGRFDLEDEVAIAKIAKKFKVSIPVMTIRLSQVAERLGK